MNGHSRVMNDEVERRYWKPGEVAKMFDCSIQWVYYRSKKIGMVRSRFQMARFTKEDIDNMFSYRNSLTVRQE